MYIKQFSIQKCILAIKLAKNLKKSLNVSSTTSTIPSISPPNSKKEKKNTKKKLTFFLLWLLTVFKASTSLFLTEEFIYNLEVL